MLKMNEVLKASKLGGGAPDYWTELFARRMAGWKIAEYTGTLPITFRSNGTALIDYRIFGTANGAGVQTENLFDKTQYAMVPVDNQGTTRCGTAIPITDGTYTLRFNNNSTRSLYIHTMLNGVITGSVNVTRLSPYTFTLSDVDTLIIRSSLMALIPWDETGYTNIMLTEGSTPPETYIPHGYKLTLKVTSGTKSKTSDVYIGDSKLGAEEYVDYEEQKVYKRTENLINVAGVTVLADTAGSKNIWRGTLETGTYTIAVYQKTILTSNERNTLCAIYSNQSTVYENGTNNYHLSEGWHTLSFTVDTAQTVALYFWAQRLSNDCEYNRIMFVKGSTAPQTYIPYLQPTDPPLPLPAIETFKGENTLDSTETLGQVTIKGKIKEA